MLRIVIFLLYMCDVCLVSACGRRRGRPSPPPDTTPPSITCPLNIHAIADPFQINTKVWWNENSVSANDNRDGPITPSRVGPAPGMLFSEGITTIRYHAKDRSGNYASCSFEIRVEVIRCNRWGDVTDGWKICHVSHDMRLGSVCRFGCYGGHELVGPSRTQCLESRQWDTATQPFCQRLRCPMLILSKDQYNKAEIQCTDDRFYRSKCTYHCSEGYDVLPGHNRVRICTEYGTWLGNTPVCVDTSPPVFTSCPYVIVGYAERSKTRGRVWWNEPVAIDNSNNVKTVQTSGPKSGAELDVGEYSATYLASDIVNNTAVCQFKIIVKQIRCHTIYPLPYTWVLCPNGRIFGSTCQFICDNGTSLNGPAYAECDKTGSTIPSGTWTFGNNQPYCENMNTCPALPAPDHGALACDTWLSGRYCQMLCQEGYVVQDDPNTAEDEVLIHKNLLVCGDSGNWYRSSNIPNCQKVEARYLTLLRINLSYLYFTGECNNSREDIKQKFLQAFTGATRISCQPPTCSVSNVQITCGNIRKRRTPADGEMTIEVNLELFPDLSSADIVKTRSAIRGSVQEAQSKGDLHLELDGVLHEPASIDVSQPEVTCHEGSAFDMKTLQCVTCNPGYYHDTLNDVCAPCSRGSYQDVARQTTCKVCGPGTTTESKGAYSATDCKAACPVGYYSGTGTPPCSACDLGWYSDTEGSVQCTKCPGDRITLTPGAVSLQQCQEFDITFTQHNDTTNFSAATLSVELALPNEFVLTFWLKCSKCKNVLNIITADGIIILFIGNDENSFHVECFGSTYNITEDLASSGRWQRLTVTYSSGSELTVVLDNKVILKDLVSSVSAVSDAGFNVTLGGTDFTGMISQLQMWSVSSAFTLTHSDTCFENLHGDMLNWGQFFELDGPFVITTSICDATDDCDSLPCLNGGSCFDTIGGFSCKCTSGYTGTLCETNIDDCNGHACDNGATCIDAVDGFACACVEGFTGDLCQTKVVDGGWTEWEVSSKCSVTCGAGLQQRSRVCEDPIPVNGGKLCEGVTTDYIVCETNNTCVDECDSDPPSIENGELNCKWANNETRVCHPTCHEGYDFDSVNYLADSGIVCGPETGYTWNHNNTENPYALLPSCTLKVKAKVNKLNYTAEYPTLTTLTSDLNSEIKSTVRDKVSQTGCVKTGRCTMLEITVYTSATEDNVRKKRTTTAVMFTIELSCDILADMNECYDLLSEIVTSLEHYINQLAFTVQYEGGSHNVGYNSSTLTGTAVCEPGFVPVWQYCVSCGKGTYDVGGYCASCPHRYYQDNEAMTSCKECPRGWTTAGVMTRDMIYCNVRTTSDSVRDWLVIGGATGAAIAVMLLAIIVVLIVCKTKQSSTQKSATSPYLDPRNKVSNAKLQFDKTKLQPVPVQTDTPEVYEQDHLELMYVKPANMDLDSSSWRDADLKTVYLPRCHSISPPVIYDRPLSVTDVHT